MPDYNTVRIYFTCLFGLVLGAVYWRVGTERCACLYTCAVVTIWGACAAFACCNRISAQEAHSSQHVGLKASSASF